MMTWFNGPAYSAGWSTAAWNEGYEARMAGHSSKQCPSLKSCDQFYRLSWIAGWSNAESRAAVHEESMLEIDDEDHN